MNQSLSYLGFSENQPIHWRLDSKTLVQHSIDKKFGVLNDTGALCIETGKYTGRSPKDKYLVYDTITDSQVDWSSSFNNKFESSKFKPLMNKMISYLQGKELYVTDAKACAHDDYKVNIRTVCEFPWSAQFAQNMFIDLTESEKNTFKEDWLIICAPGFEANPSEDGTRQGNFSILSFKDKIALIGGSGYTGEIKKGIFTVLNFELAVNRNVLPMHCSANIGQEGDTALFFGLSGTGKTTLSADPKRKLIGDDEHGWYDQGVFNFEGGCYAKCIDLTAEKEPEIYAAIRPGAIVENIKFFEGTNKINFEDSSITENTRVSYPINHIENAVIPSLGGIPKNIFFLTYDAYGVLPPISKLTKEQASYYFMSGFTAKVAGTEAGVTEPQLTFSACFGAPFLPLHPQKYAEMLTKKIKEAQANVWMINTGMTGGVYGVGSRMKLSYTRTLISAALDGTLNQIEYFKDPIFQLEIPKSCPGVPSEILNPRDAWSDKSAYDTKANELVNAFEKNFEKFGATRNLVS
ncbi:MAG: phosphoenolpyruvate carboxykinase (ATP) [Chitinophagales bacterium]|nr:phosphoenolpyruvate carboxykinase (ATP) [Chitinophagales bacterium]